LPVLIGAGEEAILVFRRFVALLRFNPCHAKGLELQPMVAIRID
jgi:hypothetical protein